MLRHLSSRGDQSRTLQLPGKEGSVVPGNGSLGHSFCSQQVENKTPSHYKLVRNPSATLAWIPPCMSET